MMNGHTFWGFKILTTIHCHYKAWKRHFLYNYDHFCLKEESHIHRDDPPYMQNNVSRALSVSVIRDGVKCGPMCFIHSFIPDLQSAEVSASFQKSEPDSRFWAVGVDRFHRKVCNVWWAETLNVYLNAMSPSIQRISNMFDILCQF